MRLASILSLLVCLPAFFAGGASARADPKVTVETKTYPVTGGSGAALVTAMDRHGPRQGFMARAIAQTTYTIDWGFQVQRKDRACRLIGTEPALHVTYVFPEARGLPPRLARRWTVFLRGVVRHEREHGRMAVAMVKAGERAVSGLAFSNDPSCNRTRREARRRADAVYARYEDRQAAFDKREHGKGGTVEKLVDALVGEE
jgi:predicted secreted Zn-dependent protease